MGRPPSSGGPAFRFIQAEVAEMETILQEHNNSMPAREVLVALADKFSETPERKGKISVQMKQVWNWFQNRRYAIRAKTSKSPGKLNVTPMFRDDTTSTRNVPQPMATPISAPALAPPVPNAGRGAPENSVMEFEAKSARDGAWYDVASFLSHRSLETGDPDVLVRFAGFGPEEDEWVNVRKLVRQRSLPCESSECVAVLPGDLILCFQEGKEQALYFDAHVLDAQRRRHDYRGCRCRFLVRYDHDQSEEIVPLRKVCRRPETDYRLQQLHAMNESASKKTNADPPVSRVISFTGETMPRQRTEAAIPAPASHSNVPAAVSAPVSHSNAPATVTVSAPVPEPNVPVATAETKTMEPKTSETRTAVNTGSSETTGTPQNTLGGV